VDRFTDATWQTEVLSSAAPVAVVFWAEWCVPSRNAAAAIEAVADRRGSGPRLGLVNVDHNPRTTERYRIQGLPTLIVFRGAEPEERRVGSMSRDDLARLLDKHA
jgi:thioredoxin